VCHCAAVPVPVLVVARAYYLSFLLYGTIRDLDIGLVYRVWLRLTTAPRTVVHDLLYPMHIQSWAEWEARGTWYEGSPLHYYELPAN
jgi:multidrug transporter EmrE-like cation transporter